MGQGNRKDRQHGGDRCLSGEAEACRVKLLGGGRGVCLDQRRDPAKAMMVASPDGVQREGRVHSAQSQWRRNNPKCPVPESSMSPGRTLMSPPAHAGHPASHGENSPALGDQTLSSWLDVESPPPSQGLRFLSKQMMSREPVLCTDWSHPTPPPARCPPMCEPQGCRATSLRTGGLTASLLHALAHSSTGTRCCSWWCQENKQNPGFKVGGGPR